MSVAKEDPARAIRNAMERLERASSGTPLADHVIAERRIVEEALTTIAGASACTEPDCPWCGIESV